MNIHYANDTKRSNVMSELTNIHWMDLCAYACVICMEMNNLVSCFELS